MNLLLPIVGFLLFQSTMPGGQHGNLRNAFRTAAETVVDNAISIDITAADTQYAAAIGRLKQSQANLSEMAADDREQEIASEANNLIFTVSACRIQARSDAAKAAACRPNIDHAAESMEALLNRHKKNGAWVDGPPA